MGFLSFTEAIFIAILSGFLSFSNLLATQIEDVLVFTRHDTLKEESSAQNEDYLKTDAPDMAKLPSRYEEGGPIPQILIDHAGYQHAAAIEATSLHADSLTPPDQVEDALVNIFCTYREDEQYIRATTGSGAFIDPRGVILTNAHVAQFLLLEAAPDEAKRDAECVIRAGNPAEPRYVAELLYISPAWIRENAALIDAESPSGTGERDYALLYVTESLLGDLPDAFPALILGDAPLTAADRDAAVVAAGYPADALRTDGIEAPLVPHVATTTIMDIYTFSGTTPDLISISASSVGKQGSSGGPVLNTEHGVIGLITTRGDDTPSGESSLRAITTAYISRTIEQETGFDLKETLTGNLAYRGEVFRNALVPFLASLLSTELD